MSEIEAWNKSKSAACSPSDWLQRNRRLWELLLPISDVEELLADSSDDIDWNGHSDRIQRIVQSSWLGKGLFGFALPQLLQKKIRETLAQEVAALAKTESLTEEKYIEARLAAKKRVREIEDLALLPERREIVLTYRSWSLKCW
eukprot:114091-Amphidinium_carterae.1